MATTVQLVLLTTVLLSCVQTGIAQCDGMFYAFCHTGLLYMYIVCTCTYSYKDKCNSAGGTAAIHE